MTAEKGCVPGVVDFLCQNVVEGTAAFTIGCPVALNAIASGVEPLAAVTGAGMTALFVGCGVKGLRYLFTEGKERRH